jgi:hypothetical protein
MVDPPVSLFRQTVGRGARLHRHIQLTPPV